MLFIGAPLLTGNESTTLRTLLELDDDRAYLVRFHHTGGSTIRFGSNSDALFQAGSIAEGATHLSWLYSVYVEFVVRPGTDIDIVNNDAVNDSRVAISVYEVS